jgi:shikimate dehydrogenase
MIYAPFNVAAHNLQIALHGAHALNIQGLNVTMPHKQTIIPMLSEIDSAAEQIGAVNTLVRTKAGFAGFNTDVVGITQTLEKHNVILTNKPVTVLGAGGAAAAAVFVAKQAGAATINLINRTHANAEKLAQAITPPCTVNAPIPKGAVIFNATPMDIHIDTRAAAFVFDMRYANARSGRDMLFFQAAAAFSIWNDMEFKTVCHAYLGVFDA